MERKRWSWGSWVCGVLTSALVSVLLWGGIGLAAQRGLLDSAVAFAANSGEDEEAILAVPDGEDEALVPLGDPADEDVFWDWQNERQFEMLPGWDRTLSKSADEHGVWVFNEQAPEGERYGYTLLDVQVDNNDDQAIRLEEKGDHWRIEAKRMGSATLEVFYDVPEELWQKYGCTADNHTDSYELTITVTDRVYFLDVFSSNNNYWALPGEGVEYRAQGRCEVYDATAPDGKRYRTETDGFTYEWQFDDDHSSTIATMGPVDEGQVTGDRATITAGQIGDDTSSAFFSVDMYVEGENGPIRVATGGSRLVISSNYHTIEPFDHNRGLAVGDDEEFSPTLKNRYVDGGEAREEPVSVRSWTWHYDAEKLAVFDASGSTVDSGVPSTSDCFFVKRLTTEDANFQLEAKYEGPDGPDDIQSFDTQYRFDWMDYRLELDCDNHRLYSDGTCEVHLDERGLPEDREFTYEVGIWDDDEFEPLPDDTRFQEDSEDRWTVTVDGAKVFAALQDLGYEDYDEVWVRVQASNKGVFIDETDLRLEFREARIEYEQNENRQMLPGWTDFVSNEGHVDIDTAEHPDGGAEYEVTAVSIENSICWDGNETDAVVSIEEDDDGEGWDIRALRYGEATIRVEYTEPEGVHTWTKDGTPYYEYTIWVVNDVYRLDMWVEGSDHALPGKTATLRAEGHHDSADDDFDYDSETFEYEWDVVEGDEWVDQIVRDPNDSGRATVSFKDLPEGWDSMGERVVVEARLLAKDVEGNYIPDDNEPSEPRVFDRREEDLYVESDYYEVWPIDHNSRLLIGESEELTPELRHYALDFDGEGWEHVNVEPEAWQWQNENDNVSVNARESEQGTWDLKRTGRWRANLQLRVDFENEDGDPDNRDRWHNYDDLDPKIWFESDDEDDRLYDDGDLALTLRRQDVPADDISYSVSLQGQGDPVALGTECYNLDEGKGTIVLDGEAVAAQFEGDQAELVVSAQYSYDDAQLAWDERRIEVRKASVEYEKRDNRSMLIGWDDNIPRMMTVWLDTDEQRDEEDEYEVTDVTVEVLNRWGDNSGDVVSVRKDKNEDDPGDVWWHLEAVGYGEALVTVTHRDYRNPDGATLSWEYEITVNPDVYIVDVWTEGSNTALPGKTVTLRANGRHETDYQFDESEETLVYEWALDERGQQWATIAQDLNDPQKATVTFNDMPGGEEYLREDMDVIVQLKALDKEGHYICDLGGDPVVFDEARCGVRVESEYLEVWPTSHDSRLNLGQTEIIEPELRWYALEFTDKNDESYVCVDEEADLQWEWDYNHDALAIERTDNPRDDVFPSFRIERKETWGTDAKLIAYFRHGMGWEDQREVRYHFDELNYELHIDGDDRLYKDADRKLDILQRDIPEDATITYKLGVWDWASEEGSWLLDLPQADGYFDVDDDGAIILDGASIYPTVSDGGYDHVHLRVEATLGDQLLAAADRDIWLREPRVEYEKKQDRTMLPGWGDDINRFNNVYIDTAERPDEEGQYEVTGVTVVQHPDEGNRTGTVVSLREQYENNGEQSNKFWWHIDAEDYGWAEVTVSYLDLDNKAQQYTYNIYVNHDVYDMDLWFDDSNRVLPGASVTMHAQGNHEVHNGDAPQDEVFVYEWRLRDGDEQFASIAADPDGHGVVEADPDGKWVRIRATAEAPTTVQVTFVEMEQGQQELREDIDVCCRLMVEDADGQLICTDDDEPEPVVFAEQWQDLHVENDYLEVWLQDTATKEWLQGFFGLPIGGSVTVRPELRHYRWTNNEYQVFDDCTWRWENVDDNLVTIDDKKDGTYTITRKREWGGGLKLVATLADGNSPDRWFPVWGIDNNLWLETKDDVDDLYSDGELTISLECGNALLLQGECGIEFTCVGWVDGSDTPQVLRVGTHYVLADNQKSVTLAGQKLFEDGFTSVGVRATLTYDDEEIASTDDFWVDVHEAFEDYDREWNRSMLVGWWHDIDAKYYVEVGNAEYPNGMDDPWYAIAGIEIESRENWAGSTGDVVKVEPKSASDGGGWRVTALAYGKAILKVSYTDIHGDERYWGDTDDPNDSMLELYVQPDVYGMFLEPENGDERYLPGTTASLYAEGWHVGDESFTPEDESFVYEWELHGDENWVEEGTVDPNDQQRFLVTFKDLPNSQNGIWREYDVECIMYLADSEQQDGIAHYEDGRKIELFRRSRHIVLGARFHELHPIQPELNPFMAVNDEVKVTPELRWYDYAYADEDPADRFHVEENVVYTWDYDDNDLAITENEDGSWTIKRLVPGDIGFVLAGTWTHDDGQVDTFERHLCFDDLGYDIDLSAAEITVENVTYNGQPQTPNLTVKIGDTTLTPYNGETGDYVIHTIPGLNYTDVTDEAIVIVKAAWDDGGDHFDEHHTYGGRQAVSFKIKPKPVTVKADDKTKTYGDADPALTATVAGTIGSDTVEYTVSRAQGSDVGKYAITPSGEAEQGNYAVTFESGTLTIDPKPVTVKADDKTKTYGDNDPALTATVEGTIGSDTVDYTLSRAQGSNVGDYTITPSGDAEQGNYAVTFEAGKLTIDPKAVTVKADDKSKTYGENDPDFTAKITGTIGSDTVEYAISRAPGNNVGDYAITPSGEAEQGNYSVTFEAGTLTINAASIADAVVTAEDQVYDGTSKSPAPTVKLGDKTLTTGDYDVAPYESNVNAGSVAISVTGKGNYTGTATGTFTIGRKVVTVKADDKSKRFDQEDPELTATVSGTVGSDTVKYDISRALGSDVGEYVITPSGATEQGNYTVTFETGTFTIFSKTVADATISAIPTQHYSKRALTPKPTVTLDGEVLVEGTDYTLSYANNTNVGKATITVKGTDGDTGTKSITFSIAQVWYRLAGANALKTMQAIAKEFGKAKVAVVTTNADFKDALAASCLAGQNGALVLTTPKGSAASETKAALKAAGVKTVYLVGSTKDVTDATMKALKSGTGVTKVERIGGASASAKAVAIAKKCGKRSDTVIIATQGGFKDALSIAPYSYATKSPILYAETNKKLSDATLKYIKDNKFAKAIIVGGPVALPASIETQLQSKAGIKKANVTRLAGNDSYATSEIIARWAMGQYKNGQNIGTYQGKALAYVKFQPATKMGANKLAVATGLNWKDALCGAALVGKNKSVLLLVNDKDAKGRAIDRYTWATTNCKDKKTAISRAYIFGGTSAVSEKEENALLISTEL